MVNSDNKLVAANQNLITETPTGILQLQNYLKQLGLPDTDIIAKPDQTRIIFTNLPPLLSSIPIENISRSTYLSKFVAASTIGLFDAALNYLWNEVIFNLRKKIDNYGLKTFYDNAIGGKRRSEYETIDDLSGVKDRVLLDTCKDLEWISDATYKKLCHVLDMRNQIGASHPNISSIKPYELLGWLQVCVEDVINEPRSASAIQAKTIIENIKDLNKTIDNETLQTMDASLKTFPTNISSTLLITLFGIYVSSDTPPVVQENILLLAPNVWNKTPDSTKYELGMKKQFFTSNLEMKKADLAHVFLEKCNGLHFLSSSEKSLILSNLCDELHLATHSYDNYYNEPPFARDIMKYIKNSADIPDAQAVKLINTFLECRIGREVSYCNGVSPNAELYYDEFFSLLSKKHIETLIILLKDHLNSLSEDNVIKTQNVGKILQLIKKDTNGARLNEIISYLITSVEDKTVHTAYKQKEFKDLCRGIIDL